MAKIVPHTLVSGHVITAWHSVFPPQSRPLFDPEKGFREKACFSHRKRGVDDGAVGRAVVRSFDRVKSSRILEHFPLRKCRRPSRMLPWEKARESEGRRGRGKGQGGRGMGEGRRGKGEGGRGRGRGGEGKGERTGKNGGGAGELLMRRERWREERERERYSTREWVGRERERKRAYSRRERGRE